MDKFFSLPLEKQNTILDAALTCFGKNGYKKASVNDIATAAGISKAMVFHYFGSKKTLYLYLVTYCGTILMNEMSGQFDSSVTDFFDHILHITHVKIAVVRNHPAILSFISSAYFEQDPEVLNDITNILKMGEKFRQDNVYQEIDAEKLKKGVDPKLVMNIVFFFSEGFLSQMSKSDITDIDAVSEEFETCLKLLKNNFYKEDYLI